VGVVFLAFNERSKHHFYYEAELSVLVLRAKKYNSPLDATSFSQTCPLLSLCFARYTTGKVGTGYTMEEVKELNAKVEPYKVPYGKAGKAAGGKAWPPWLHPWNMKADDGNRRSQTNEGI